MQLKVTWQECKDILEKELGVNNLQFFRTHEYDSDRIICEYPDYVLGDLSTNKETE